MELKMLILLALLGGVLSAPFVKEDEAKTFIRQKRQTGNWDPNSPQNVWGYTIQEQANEYWTVLRTNAQYYMDMGRLMFDPSVADENNRMYMEMLRNAGAHLDSHTTHG
ncbi:hypothetical protein NQD34_008124 [Periophthalmus magnuspinnatus]|uniref:uncharacterized protein C3orf85-like n=1 Tax=Periophthalmus magnuspinnatus TaxID=409849 RepID=UPI0022C19DC6|nr:uncharacterized protein C3orf85-like [Periophthalmus magnuspinnatus]KAJ0002975.1 hypothetical protein NQD34_008124 [Periophthalmus magnuspinnatus]